MSAEKKKQLGILGLIVMLMVVLVGSLVFMGAVAGWFNDPKVVLDEEYACAGEECNFIELASGGEYDELVKAEKSFVIFIDQSGCTTADRLRGYVQDWSVMVGEKTYRMMFEEMKKTILSDNVKYYPSVVIVSKGKVKSFLRADSDDDAEIYNNYDAFVNWMGKYI